MELGTCQPGGSLASEMNRLAYGCSGVNFTSAQQLLHCMNTPQARHPVSGAQRLALTQMGAPSYFGTSSPDIEGEGIKLDG